MCSTWLPNSFSLVASFFLFSSFTSVVFITDLFSTVRHPAVNWSLRCKRFQNCNFDQPVPSQLCLLPLCFASSKNCQSYPQLLQPIQSSEKLFNQNFISPLCHLWTWVGQACCSHPQSFQETFQLPLPPWCMLEIFNFLSLYRRVCLTSSPSEDGCFPQASALFDLDPLLKRFWHFRSLPPFSGTHSQLFDQCLIL